MISESVFSYRQRRARTKKMRTKNRMRTNKMRNRHAIGFVVMSVVAVAFLMPMATAQIRGGGEAPASVGVRPMSGGSGIGTPGIARSGAGFVGGPGRSHRGHSFGRSAIFLP